MKDASEEWLNALVATIQYGKPVSPRGKDTLELMSPTYKIDMRRPVVTVPERKLNYKFMAAEAYWILSGDDRVVNIAPYNPNIAKFSDDGVSFYGAYGPKIVEQLDYVVDKLVEDSNSRQAGLTIWRETPPPSKDIPCTVAIFFNIRENKLNATVFMRSNDLWLGFPYDVFNFSMLAHYVCGLLRECLRVVTPGTLYLTAASSHLYETNHDDAVTIIHGADAVQDQFPTPSVLHQSPEGLLRVLKALRDTSPGDTLRWWEPRP